MRTTSFALFTTLLFTLLFSSVSTLPFQPWSRTSGRRLHKRGLPGAVYICDDSNFRGNCGWVAPDTECHIAGTGPASPKSIGPDPGGFCVLYAKSTCEDQVATLRFPGTESAMPNFMAIQCFADQTQKRLNSTSGTAVINGQMESVPVRDDPRLAGGVGSKKYHDLKGVLAKMEEDGFKEGMIGLEKKTYY